MTAHAATKLTIIETFDTFRTAATSHGIASEGWTLINTDQGYQIFDKQEDGSLNPIADDFDATLGTKKAEIVVKLQTLTSALTLFANAPRV